MSFKQTFEYLLAQVKLEITWIIASLLGIASLFFFKQIKERYLTILENLTIGRSLKTNKMFTTLLGETGADRIYIFKFEEGEIVSKDNHNLMINCSNETLRENIYSVADKRSKLRVTKFNGLFTDLLDNKYILINNIHLIPSMYARALFSSTEVLSVCMHLIYDFNKTPAEPTGILCFDFVRKEVDFTVAENKHIVQTLILTAEKISFLAHR